MTTTNCPLCGSRDSKHFYSDKRADYYGCDTCELIFVPSEFWLAASEEKLEYDLHNNDVEDLGYRKFLNRLAAPLLQWLEPASHGLDFGCGPGPALAAMLNEAGHKVELYDPFYANDPEKLTQCYDFITSTEVFEHLQQPRQVLEKLLSILNTGGTLAIMTQLAYGQEEFKTWRYKSDKTHIIFFSKNTFEWIARQYDLQLEFVNDNVIFLQK
jgi:2-polyprenyl-3-methyl-5-hydroxy-6-metoxy-1,4-benzoquinol methylase